jgi:hypothetical protein
VWYAFFSFFLRLLFSSLEENEGEEVRITILLLFFPPPSPLFFFYLIFFLALPENKHKQIIIFLSFNSFSCTSTVTQFPLSLSLSSPTRNYILEMKKKLKKKEIREEEEEEKKKKTIG